MSRFRHYVFTLNNYTPENVESINTLVARGKAKHLCYQPEIGEQGTKHLQGAISFADAISLLQAKARIGGEPHLEPAKDYPAACTYCRKEATRDPAAGFAFTEHGQAPKGQGNRSDWDAIKDACKAGATLEELVELDAGLFGRHSNGVLKMQSIYKKPRASTDPPTVLWFWGPTGSGKSRAAHDTYPDAYYKMPGNKWWDGYEQQDCVIVDDYRRDFCTFSELLRLLDRYPHRVEMKGASVQFKSTTIIITTPKDPRSTWEGRSEEDLEQLLRRITEVREFKAPGPIIPPVFPVFAGNPPNLANQHEEQDLAVQAALDGILHDF